MNFSKMNDGELYEYCRKVGLNARMWKNRFIAALPEVYKRRLYKKKGFCSIHEFAAKMAGISCNVVDEMLRVDAKLRDKPRLKALIRDKGLNKVRLVANVVDKGTENFWIEKINTMTKSALETYLKESRKSHPGMERGLKPDLRQGGGQNTLFGSENSISSSDDTSRSEKHTFTIQIDSETEIELRKLKQKIEKEKKEPVDWNTVMKELVKKANESSPKKHKRIIRRQKSAKVTRHIPAHKKREIAEKYKGRCAFPSCRQPGGFLHHAHRFALHKKHEQIVPLCKTHHELAHQSLIKNETRRPKHWRIKSHPDKKCPKYNIDRLFMRNKMAFRC
jgi:hypothetical protein